MNKLIKQRSGSAYGATCIGSHGRRESHDPYVQVLTGPEKGKRFILTPDRQEIVLGRGSECDFRIHDPNISRRHALLKRDWNQMTIEDVGAKNGIFIRQKKITHPVVLKDSDEIMLGTVALVLVDPSAKFICRLEGVPFTENSSSVRRFDPEKSPSHEDKKITLDENMVEENALSEEMESVQDSREEIHTNARNEQINSLDAPVSVDGDLNRAADRESLQSPESFAVSDPSGAIHSQREVLFEQSAAVTVQNSSYTWLDYILIFVVALGFIGIVFGLLFLFGQL